MYVRSSGEHASATNVGPSRHGDNYIDLNPIHPMPLTVNNDKQNIWRVACIVPCLVQVSRPVCALLSCVWHTCTALSKHGVGVEPLF